MRVTGLAAGATVLVAAEATDYRRERWRAQARFVADADGAVDLAHAVPLDGTYRDADGMGLFWSMAPAGGDAEREAFYPPFPELARTFDVRLSATATDRPTASRTVHRRWLATGATHRALRPATERLAGDLYLPAPGGAGRTPVLLLGGSEGGSSQKFVAALLASRGHPALSLAYFGTPGRPAALRDVALEYFALAARYLARQPGGKPGPVAVGGYSRGTEAALLLAQHHPDLVGALFLHAPNDRVWPSFPDPAGSAWTRGGRPVPQAVIPLDRVAGPVLVVAGTADQVWDAAGSARAIAAGVRRRGVRAELLSFPAGHAVGTIPYLPAGTLLVDAETGAEVPLGGSRAADHAARAASWPRVLALLGGS